MFDDVNLLPQRQEEFRLTPDQVARFFATPLPPDADVRAALGAAFIMIVQEEFGVAASIIP
jgi:hypothetical protein